MKKYFNHQTKKALKLQNLITIESLDVSGDFSYPEEIHDFFEFVYVTKGEICNKIDGEEYLLTPGTLAFVDIGQTHEMNAHDEVNYINILFIPFSFILYKNQKHYWQLRYYRINILTKEKYVAKFRLIIL